MEAGRVCILCAGIIRFKFTGHLRFLTKLSASSRLRDDLAPRTSPSYGDSPAASSVRCPPERGSMNRRNVLTFQDASFLTEHLSYNNDPAGRKSPDRGSATRRNVLTFEPRHSNPNFPQITMVTRVADPRSGQSCSLPYSSRKRALLYGQSFGSPTNLAFAGLFSM